MKNDILKNGISDSLLNHFFARWQNKKCNNEQEKHYFEHLFFSALSGRRLVILKINQEGKIIGNWLVKNSSNSTVLTVDGEMHDVKFKFIQSKDRLQYCLTTADEYELAQQCRKEGKNPPRFDYAYQFSVLVQH